MSKILDRAGLGAAITAVQNDSNLDSLSGIVEAVAGTTYTVTIDDQNRTLEFTNAGAVTVTLTDIATISAALHTTSFKVTLKSVGAGGITINRGSTDTFDDATTSKAIGQYDCITIQTDSTSGKWNIVSKYRIAVPATANNLAALNATGDIIDSLVETDGAGNITADVTGNASTATALETARTLEISGDATGSDTFDGSGNANIAISLADNSVNTAQIVADAVTMTKLASPTAGTTYIIGRPGLEALYTTSSGTYARAGEYWHIRVSGTVRCWYQHNGDGSSSSSVRIYINGTLVDTQTNSSATYATRTYDAAVNCGDVIHFEHASTGSGTVNLRLMRIYSNTDTI